MFGITAKEKVEANQIELLIMEVQEILEVLEDDNCAENKEDIEDLEELSLELIDIYTQLTTVNNSFYLPLPLIANKHVTIDSLSDFQICEWFRFRNKDQLHRLYAGFRFPMRFKINGYVFSGEEILLCGLFRLHSVNTFGDSSWISVFGWDQPQASHAFKLFLNYLACNWLYLINDHIKFWAPYLPHLSECIRLKLLALGDSTHRSSHIQGGFNVFGFIDNTLIDTCRPGGGPTQDGPNAPRNPPELQQSFYTGFKKQHGLKWQTVDLPNGMNFHVWGPCSMRHNDIYTYYKSDINNKIANVQLGNQLQFKIYGDSAYVVLNESHLTHRYEEPSGAQVLTNECMSSCRQCIEWHYGDTSRLWKMIDYAHGLKIRQMNVVQMVNAAIILRNAHVTMNGNITGEYFQCNPPTFESWTSRGPLPEISCE